MAIFQTIFSRQDICQKMLLFCCQSEANPTYILGSFMAYQQEVLDSQNLSKATVDKGILQSNYSF